MSKSDELARLLENAEQLIRADIIKSEDDFLKELYTHMLKTIVNTKIAAQNNVLPKGIQMFGFVYIISDFPEKIPKEIKDCVFAATKYYREVYSK